jgi:hypothetical protein
MPNVGWAGVFKVAIAFDMIAAVLAWFVLRKMKPPVKAQLQGGLREAARAVQATKKEEVLV